MKQGMLFVRMTFFDFRTIRDSASWEGCSADIEKVHMAGERQTDQTKLSGTSPERLTRSGESPVLSGQYQTICGRAGIRIMQIMASHPHRRKAAECPQARQRRAYRNGMCKVSGVCTERLYPRDLRNDPVIFSF